MLDDVAVNPSFHVVIALPMIMGSFYLLDTYCRASFK